MFPQLVAGPIVRYESIEAEIVQRHVSLDDFYYGLQRFIAGLGKKLLIADVLAQPADLILQGGCRTADPGKSMACSGMLHIADIL